jgi:hypothetical protein
MNMDNDDWDDDVDDMGDDDEDESDVEEDGGEDGGEDGDDDDDDDFEEIEIKYQLEFRNTCLAIGRNDPEKKTVFATIEKGYRVPLGNALVGNTHVETLHLRLWPENINSQDDDNWGVHNIALILQYLREGSAFRMLRIQGGSVEYTAACVQAIAQNPNARKLMMDDTTEVPLLEMIDLLRNTETLEDLSVSMVNSTALAEAIQANQSLKTLSLSFTPDAWPKPNGVILHHLHSHTKLQFLIIDQRHESSDMDTNQVDVALCLLLAHPATRLVRLYLFSMTFDRSRMELLMEGLKANCSLSYLDLSWCKSDDEAVTLWESVELTSPIQELCTDSHNGRLVALLALGFSNLQILEWDWSDRDLNVDAFWNTLLAADSSRTGLKTLRLTCWPVTKCEAMNSCIPKLVALRELHFQCLSSYDAEYLRSDQFTDAYQSFVRAVRQSAGLFTVPVQDLPWIGKFLGEAESRLLDAYLERNRMLSQLLSRPGLDHLIQEGEDGTDLYLYPSLFSVSQQSPYVALNAILTGLLILSDGAGH